MKTQMKFQKILCLVTLIIGALVFVYSCSFMSGDLANLYDWQFKRSGVKIGAEDVYPFASDINGVLVVLSLVMIVASVFLFITACNTRRNYYITNIVASIAVAAIYAVLAIVGIALVSAVLAKFETALDWDKYEYYYTNFKTPSGAPEYGEYVRTYTMFILGYIVYAIVIVNALALVYNLLWKLKLMKGEKQLLENGMVMEVA